MKRPLSGKRYFEALGRRASSQGLPLNSGRIERRVWPFWAQCAWARGWIMQPSPKERTKIIAEGFVAQAKRENKTLRETVSQFLEEKEA
ncbi:hypothetical protein [Robbsia andropogonis]|uniref:hypothetical protein n=1 Tax=Robbsia andropogonis TaxID=28092 RepID=UPI000ADD788F|nr:hypothetical protein [Robbsia andropogonis]